jgi:ketosteroid isomerase-like protein
MPSSNVALVRSIYEAWQHGDYDLIEGLDPEIEFAMADGPAPASSKGLSALTDTWRDFLSAWEGVRQIPDEYRELDDERVLVFHHFRARGKRSGLELGQVRREAAAVFTIRSGKVVRIVHYFDRGKAVAELGNEVPGS